MAEAVRKSPVRCELNANGCLTLADILRAFNAPLKEEQAWAICFQCVRCVRQEWMRFRPQANRSGDSHRNDMRLMSDTSHVLIHKDGNIHPASCVMRSSHEQQDKNREAARTEAKLVSSLGRVIYCALDYGLTEDEERTLSPPLEELIDQMISADLTDRDSSMSDADGHDTDEGIEEDHGELDEGRTARIVSCTLDKVLEKCCNHLSNPQQAEGHYKAVCRALVAEALELSMFLQQVSNGTREFRFNAHSDLGSSADLDNLRIRDWAMLWVQVIHELRRGVKLKKVDHNPQRIEYALTPYEILMDDIRRRRYKLNKVMVNGDIPRRVKQDAHALILEFIRSRPPLIPVSKRKLPPAPPAATNAYEELMHSIRGDHKLRTITNKTVETSRTKLNEKDVTPQPTRRLIKADVGLLNLNSFDQDDDDYLLSPDKDQPCNPDLASSNGGTKSPWLQTVARDMAIHTEVIMPERRHSYSSLCCPEDSSSRMVPTFPASMHHRPNSLPVWSPARQTPSVSHPITWPHSNPLECLSLTLEEVVHIRSELTKAELENLLADTPQYEDIVKRKLCFTCRKTKFSLFGPWGQKCRLCKRTVCEKCCCKMRVPTEHFSKIPVYTLSPSPCLVSDDDSSPKNTWRLVVTGFLSGSSGSVPSSPTTPSKNSHNDSKSCIVPPKSLSSGGNDNSPTDVETESNEMMMTSMPAILNTNGNDICGDYNNPISKRPTLLRSLTMGRSTKRVVTPEHRERLRGSLMTVCTECKAMMCHIIMASRNSMNASQRKERLAATFPRRVKATEAPTLMSQSSSSTTSINEKRSRDLHLNLSPMY